MHTISVSDRAVSKMLESSSAVSWSEGDGNTEERENKTKVDTKTVSDNE
jgi:hypothetical protein